MGKDASDLRREIAATRSRMDDTVDALQYKVDVPARAKDAAADRVEAVKETLAAVADGALEGASAAGQRVAGVVADVQHTIAAKFHPGESTEPERTVRGDQA